MKILSVDDHAESLFFLGALLRGHGHTVDTASDGQEALNLAENGGYDLMISDILMPRMDGFQLCRELRRNERHRHLPFIFYTGTYTDSRDESFALSLGADRFLVKPLDPSQLLAEVERVVAEKAARGPEAAAQSAMTETGAPKLRQLKGRGRPGGNSEPAFSLYYRRPTP